MALDGKERDEGRETKLGWNRGQVRKGQNRGQVRKGQNRGQVRKGYVRISQVRIEVKVE